MLIKGLIALAFGTLSLGITEFVAMGLLPYIAQLRYCRPHYLLLCLRRSYRSFLLTLCASL